MTTSNLAHTIVSKAEFRVNGELIASFSGDGSAFIKHQGITEKNCRICNKFKQQYSASDMQYYYGTLHKYIKNKKKYECYLGNDLIDMVFDEVSDFEEELQEGISAHKKNKSHIDSQCLPAENPTA
jgi:hypothetical protein